MKYFDPLVFDLVEDKIWIAYERNRPYVSLFPLPDRPSTPRPFFDASNRGSKIALDRRSGQRIHRLESYKNFVEIGKRAASVPPSSPAVFRENRFNLRFSGKLPLLSFHEATLDGSNFLWRRGIGVLLQLSLNLKGGLRQILLSAFGPLLGALQNFFDHLCFHVAIIAHKGPGGYGVGRQLDWIG
jgi:hypothetical protein